MEGSTPTADDSPQQPRYRARGDAAGPVGVPAAAHSAPGISLGPRDVLVGRLVFEGDLRVQGTVEGEATLSGDVHVDGHGTVKAKLQARNMHVRGAVEGEVTARERLTVAGSGNVSGTIRVARLVVEDGALLNGTITMERSTPVANGRAPEA
jgi:cytoskeletal protein CcmA (bactofilin family)